MTHESFFIIQLLMLKARGRYYTSLANCNHWTSFSTGHSSGSISLYCKARHPHLLSRSIPPGLLAWRSFSRRSLRAC